MTRPTVLVGEVSDQIRGVSYGKSDAIDSPTDGYMPVLRAGNITEFGLVYTDLVYVPKRFISGRQLLRSGDVLIAASSGSIDVVGKAASVINDYEGAFGAFCKVLRPLKSQVDPRYFAHFFKTADYRRTVSNLAAGANINNLKNEHLDELLIPLPSLSEQRRIAAILDQADTLRAKRREALAQLDSLTQSIFMEMFGDPETNPMRWPERVLSELVRTDDSINYGVVQPGEDHPGGVPLIRVGDLVNGHFELSTLKTISPIIEAAYKRSRLRGDEVLVSCVGSIGVVVLATTAMTGFNIARAVARIPASESIDRIYLANYLRTAYVQRYFASELRIVSQPTLNIKQIAQTQVLSPPLIHQQAFATRIQAVEALKTQHRAALTELDALFASLQHRAFQGEL